MKRFIVILFLILGANIFAQNIYKENFTDQRLRVDLIFAGDANNQDIFLSSLVRESGGWSGSRKNLTQDFGYGEYKYEIINRSGEKVFSKGFNNLFQEWRTTADAKITKQAFKGSVWIPYPKDQITLNLYARNKSNGEFELLSSFPIDPADKLIVSEVQNSFNAIEVVKSGSPQDKVDLVFIAEGYTQNEMDIFMGDVKRYTEYLFETEPYKSRRDDFNIWALQSVSKESGTDIPQDSIWRSTVAGSTFYTFRLDRYLTAPDHTQIAGLVSNIPCDAIYVLVNTNKYGGGGIYNFYGLSMRSHKFEKEVFIHELGHSFAGLADEYFESTVSYEDFYNLAIEPWEPNLTTLKNFGSKWKNMLKDETPIPTEPSIENQNTIGVYEGGGYIAKGIYRPYIDCRMRSNISPGFCPVCSKAIERMIDHYTK